MQERIPFSNASTSLQAAKSMTPGARRRAQERIAEAIQSARDAALFGLTAEQVCERTGLRVQTVTARINHMTEAGLLRDSGKRRRTTSGREAIVWEPGTGVPLPGSRKAQVAGRLVAAVRRTWERAAAAAQSELEACNAGGDPWAAVRALESLAKRFRDHAARVGDGGDQ